MTEERKLWDCYEQVLENWFGDKESGRKFINEVIETIEKGWNDKNIEKNIFIIEAPTGYGKSTISAAIALFSITGSNNLKCIVAFPLRTLLEDQYSKFVEDEIKKRNGKMYKKTSILGKVDYGSRTKIIGKRYMHNPDSRYLIKPITLTTVDALALTLFGIPPECIEKVARAWDGTSRGSLGHYLFSWASVALSNIVLDEVHLLADSTKSLSFLIALMKIAVDFDQKLILMSATLPTSLKEKIKECAKEFGFKDKLCIISFSRNENRGEITGWDESFAEERESKVYDIDCEALKEEEKYDKIVEWIENNKKMYSRVIVVFNTVREAIEFYTKKLNELKELFHEENILLIHSRFTEKDREEKNKKIQQLKEKGEYLIIATQVIEAGVDISSNLFITDIAPANSLIQRLGRFLRYKEENKGKIIIWYEVDENGNLKESNGMYKVYDYKLTEKTLEWIKNNKSFNVHLPEASNENGYRKLLDSVYSKEDFKVDKDAIKSFEGIFLHLDIASLVAIEKFFEMEGSFVRESLLVPVIPEEKVKEVVKRYNNEVEAVRKIGESVIPVSFQTISKYYGKEEEVEALVKKVEEDKVVVEREKIYFSTSPSSLLRFMLRRGVVALIVKGEYSEDEGLKLEGDR